MSSRMDRYYENHPNDMKRTNKNSKLYDNLYNNTNYDNVEEIPINVGKEIDIDKLKTMLDERESYSDLKNYRIIKPEETVTRRVKYYVEEDTNSHDINEMIGKARRERPFEERRRSLEDTQVLTLQELVSKKEYAKKTKMNKDEVKDLIHTICDTNLLKSDDGTGLLDSLKATGKTVISPSIKQILDDAKKEAKDNEKMDDSFFTSSLGFKKEDLDMDEDDDSFASDEKTTKFLIVLGIIFIIIVIFIIVKFVLV